jgi:hypothetical protein
LLLVSSRSVMIAAKAIVLNLLSVGAAYGVLVWVVQYGHLQGLLGFHSTHAMSWLPIFMFVQGCPWTTTCSSWAGQLWTRRSEGGRGDRSARRPLRCARLDR